MWSTKRLSALPSTSNGSPEDPWQASGRRGGEWCTNERLGTWQPPARRQCDFGLFVVHQSHRVVSGLLSTPLLPLPSHLSKGDLEIALRLQMGGVPLQGGPLSTRDSAHPRLPSRSPAAAACLLARESQRQGLQQGVPRPRQQRMPRQRAEPSLKVPKCSYTHERCRCLSALGLVQRWPSSEKVADSGSPSSDQAAAASTERQRKAACCILLPAVPSSPLLVGHLCAKAFRKRQLWFGETAPSALTQQLGRLPLWVVHCLQHIL